MTDTHIHRQSLEYRTAEPRYKGSRIAGEVLDVRCRIVDSDVVRGRERRSKIPLLPSGVRRIDHTPQRGATEGNAADDALMVLRGDTTTAQGDRAPSLPATVPGPQARAGGAPPVPVHTPARVVRGAHRARRSRGRHRPRLHEAARPPVTRSSSRTPTDTSSHPRTRTHRAFPPPPSRWSRRWPLFTTWEPRSGSQPGFTWTPTGNLKVKGYGDPLLVSEAWEEIADALTVAGVRFNDLIVDDTYFAPAVRIPGTGRSTNPYDAPVGALCANFNTVAFDTDERGRLVSGESQTPLIPFVRDKIRKLGLTRGRYNLHPHATRGDPVRGAPAPPLPQGAGRVRKRRRATGHSLPRRQARLHLSIPPRP